MAELNTIEDQKVEGETLEIPSVPEKISTAMPAASVSSEPVLLPAGFVRRALAFIIDIILLNCLYLVLVGVGGLAIQLAGGGLLMEEDPMAAVQKMAAPFVSAWFVLFMAYFAFFHFQEGQTPAKKILRIKVVNQKGALLSHIPVLLRSFCYFLSFSFLGFGFLMILFGQKRGLHDLITGSYVVLSSD